MIKSLFLYLVVISVLGSTCKNSVKDKEVKSKPFKFFDPALATVPDSFKYLLPILDTSFLNDQKYRSTSGIENSKKQAILDSVNLSIVKKIINKYGLLGIKDVGFVGKTALHSVLLHSNIATKKEYYPVLLEAVSKYKATFGDLAIFEDKLNFQLHRRQYYGTQLTKFKGLMMPYPIEDVDVIDSLRKIMKIGSMDNYLYPLLKTRWDISIYKKEQAEMVKNFKVNDSTPIRADVNLLRK